MLTLLTTVIKNKKAKAPEPLLARQVRSRQKTALTVRAPRGGSALALVQGSLVAAMGTGM